MSNHSSQGREWNRIRAVVLARDGHVCVQCGNKATTVDHIVPKVLGGTDEESNLQAMCLVHNSKKGSKTVQRGVYWDTEAFPNGLPAPYSDEKK